MSAACRFPGCTLPVHGYGHCKTHRQQVRRGKPLTPIAPRSGSVPFSERFWSKINRGPGCWEWVGNMRPQGYGTFTVDGKHEYPHRLMWQMTNGAEIPADMVIDHICLNRKCVNPEHLRLFDRQLNAEYMQRGRRPVPASGFRGVYRNRDKWSARVKYRGVVYNLGQFTNPEEAASVAAAKRAELFQFPEYQGAAK